MNPQYPVYVISKGRPKSCLTVKQLELMKVPFRLVVEPTEFDEYAKYVSSSKLLTLPFHDLNQGSIPARNWVWEHSLSEGQERHWILDDKIERFYRLNRNLKIFAFCGNIFRCAEEFTDRYTNVALSGFNYECFCKKTDPVPPYYLNTRIYSCILIRNDLPYRWRGRYNEDTDLSLRALKDGWCTVLFNAFLAGKVTTLRMKGGNTDNIYMDGDNRFKFAQSLEELHPDVVKVSWKFGRWHHHVNYKPFRENKLIRKEGLMSIPDKINEYGMKLISLK